MKNINLVSKYLYKRNIDLKVEKYEFYKEKVNFLGFIVRQSRICINLDKI